MLGVYHTEYLNHNSETTLSLRSTAADLGVHQPPNGLDFAMKCPSCSAVYDVSMCGACSKRLEACLCFTLCFTLRLTLGLTLGLALCLTLGLALCLTLCLALCLGAQLVVWTFSDATRFGG